MMKKGSVISVASLVIVASVVFGFAYGVRFGRSGVVVPIREGQALAYPYARWLWNTPTAEKQMDRMLVDDPGISAK